MPNTRKLLPKWQNFAESGYTDGSRDRLCDQMLELKVAQFSPKDSEKVSTAVLRKKGRFSQQLKNVAKHFG